MLTPRQRFAQRRFAEDFRLAINPYVKYPPTFRTPVTPTSTMPLCDVLDRNGYVIEYAAPECQFDGIRIRQTPASELHLLTQVSGLPMPKRMHWEECLRLDIPVERIP